MCNNSLSSSHSAPSLRTKYFCPPPALTEAPPAPRPGTAVDVMLEMKIWPRSALCSVAAGCWLHSPSYKPSHQHAHLSPLTQTNIHFSLPAFGISEITGQHDCWDQSAPLGRTIQTSSERWNKEIRIFMRRIQFFFKCPYPVSQLSLSICLLSGFELNVNIWEARKFSDLNAM